MEEAAIYVVVIEGKPQGPFSLNEVKALNIRPGTFVKKPGMDDYKEAHAIPELRELFGFRQQQTAPQYYAAFDLRLLAMVIDYLAIALAFTILVLLSFVFIQGRMERLAVFIAFAPAIPVLKFIYGCIAEASPKQATIGKRLANIKVTDMMGNRLSLPNSIGRNAAKICSTAPVFFGYLYSFLNKKQQCFHDILADTLVVKERLV